MHSVMIVDDQRSSQALMKYAISTGGDKYKLIKSISNADHVVAELRYDKVDLILLDIYTGGNESGITVARQVKELYPEIKIIILTYVLQKKHLDDAKKIGCEGFWYKDHADMDLIDVMDKVMSGEIYYPQSQPVVTIGTAKTTDFTKKELEILQAKVNGYSGDEICDMLDIKLRTLNTHICNIKNKTGYNNLLKLIADVSSKRFIIADENAN